MRADSSLIPNLTRRSQVRRAPGQRCRRGKRPLLSCSSASAKRTPSCAFFLSCAPERFRTTRGAVAKGRHIKRPQTPETSSNTGRNSPAARGCRRFKSKPSRKKCVKASKRVSLTPHTIPMCLEHSWRPRCATLPRMGYMLPPRRRTSSRARRGCGPPSPSARAWRPPSPRPRAWCIASRR